MGGSGSLLPRLSIRSSSDFRGADMFDGCVAAQTTEFGDEAGLDSVPYNRAIQGRCIHRGDAIRIARQPASGKNPGPHAAVLRERATMINVARRATALLLATMTAASAAEQPPATQAAAASPPVDTAEAMLARMDRNADGRISFEEYRNAMIRRFGARDANDDGALDGDEFPREWLAGADVQGAVGKVTFEQFTLELPLVFDSFDVDKDGQLAPAEIGAFAAARKTQETR
jgi:hypothetical protein